MSRTDWSRINRRIRECFESANPLECLIRLFNSTEDGWVAFNIAGLLQDEGRLDEALKYYKIAYERLPLPKYKAMAKQEIEKIEKKLAEKDSSEDILFIVSCTRRKIWDVKSAPKYVPAKDAYIGDTMKNWLNSDESKTNRWIIFSSKYGFIEPDHPIKNYDIHFVKSPEAISEDTLLRQILFHEFDGFKIADFKKIYFVGTDDYYRKLRLVFLRAGKELERYELPKKD